MVATADNPLTRHQLLNLALPRHQLLNLPLGKHQLPNLALRPQVHAVAMLTSLVSLLVVMVDIGGGYRHIFGPESGV